MPKGKGIVLLILVCCLLVVGCSQHNIVKNLKITRVSNTEALFCWTTDDETVGKVEYYLAEDEREGRYPEQEVGASQGVFITIRALLLAYDFPPQQLRYEHRVLVDRLWSTIDDRPTFEIVSITADGTEYRQVGKFIDYLDKPLEDTFTIKAILLMVMSAVIGCVIGLVFSYCRSRIKPLGGKG